MQNFFKFLCKIFGHHYSTAELVIFKAKLHRNTDGSVARVTGGSEAQLVCRRCGANLLK